MLFQLFCCFDIILACALFFSFCSFMPFFEVGRSEDYNKNSLKVDFRVILNLNPYQKYLVQYFVQVTSLSSQ